MRETIVFIFGALKVMDWSQNLSRRYIMIDQELFRTKGKSTI